jgi:hypothetical protein
VNVSDVERDGVYRGAVTPDGHGTAEIMRATGKAKTVIPRWQERALAGTLAITVNNS